MSSIVFARILAVALGGALGALARYAVTRFFLNRSIISMPFGTLTVNILGSFLIGFLITFFILSSDNLTNPLYHFIFIGVLGALTTYSTFAYDTFLLWKTEKTKAILFVFLNIFGSFLSFFLGIFLGFFLVLPTQC